MLMLTAGGHMDGPEEESTSGASTTDSAHRGLVAPTLRSDSSVHRQLSNQLRELEDENKKLAIICCHCCLKGSMSTRRHANSQNGQLVER